MSNVSKLQVHITHHCTDLLPQDRQLGLMFFLLTNLTGVALWKKKAANNSSRARVGLLRVACDSSLEPIQMYAFCGSHPHACNDTFTAGFACCTHQAMLRLPFYITFKLLQCHYAMFSVSRTAHTSSPLKTAYTEFDHLTKHTTAGSEAFIPPKVNVNKLPQLNPVSDHYDVHQILLALKTIAGLFGLGELFFFCPLAQCGCWCQQLQAEKYPSPQ